MHYVYVAVPCLLAGFGAGAFFAKPLENEAAALKALAEHDLLAAYNAYHKVKAETLKIIGEFSAAKNRYL